MGKDARTCTVTWTGLHEFKDFLEKAPPVADAHFALYMILETLRERFSGPPPDLELIYLGIVKSEQRDLRMRVNEHNKAWLKKVVKKQIYLKFGMPSTSLKIDGRLMEDVESALIFGAQPRENDKKKQSYNLYDDLIVKNEKHGGFLKATYDTEMQRKTGT
jgi:hypothetical protein